MSFELIGDYNKCEVMLPTMSDIDQETVSQIYGFLNNKAFVDTKIVIMPDCHAGKGSCVGFTMTLNDMIIPNIVGVDIACGVVSVNLGKVNLNLEKLDNFIYNNIPHGFSVRDTYCKKVPDKLRDSIKQVSEKIGSDAGRNIKAVGSLGGGNHFIEVGKDSEDNLWLTIHSGSRKFGLDIATYHQNIAKGITSNRQGLDFLLGVDRDAYFRDMRVAQDMATANRLVIVGDILDFLNLKIGSERVIESIHNYIDFLHGVVRKGAVSAQLGEDVIIPFNMEDGLILGRGLGNSEWNYSAPHGAGRVLSRSKAKKSLDLSEAQLGMEIAGIYTTSLCESTLDEAKSAYKDKELILDSIRETVEVVDFVKPVYNFKSK